LHQRRHWFVQQPGSQSESKERLKQLQLGDSGNATLIEAAIPEDESDEHAEDRHVREPDPSSKADLMPTAGHLNDRQR
jgi:hypothetical protein